MYTNLWGHLLFRSKTDTNICFILHYMLCVGFMYVLAVWVRVAQAYIDVCIKCEMLSGVWIDIIWWSTSVSVLDLQCFGINITLYSVQCDMSNCYHRPHGLWHGRTHSYLAAFRIRGIYILHRNDILFDEDNRARVYIKCAFLTIDINRFLTVFEFRQIKENTRCAQSYETRLCIVNKNVEVQHRAWLYMYTYIKICNLFQIYF